MRREPERPVTGGNLGDDQDYRGLPDEEEVRRAVLEHLQADQTVDATGIEIEVEEGRVRLRGRVGSEVERDRGRAGSLRRGPLVDPAGRPDA